MQQHGSKLRLAHLSQLEMTAVQLERADKALGEEIEAVNRKRKAEQERVGPELQRLRGGVGAPNQEEH